MFIPWTSRTTGLSMPFGLVTSISSSPSFAGGISQSTTMSAPSAPILITSLCLLARFNLLLSSRPPSPSAYAAALDAMPLVPTNRLGVTVLERMLSSPCVSLPYSRSMRGLCGLLPASWQNTMGGAVSSFCSRSSCCSPADAADKARRAQPVGVAGRLSLTESRTVDD